MAIQKITSGIIQDGAIVAADIVSIANTQITGNIVSSQITSVANTQITGNIVSSQITSVANTQITGNITATNITGGSNGTIPYQSASGTTQMLAVGTSGQLLQTNGASAPTWVTFSAGFTLGTPVASTSGTSITFTGIPAGTKQIVIMFSGVSTNGTSAKRIRLGDSGGIETTGYNSTGHSFINSTVAATTGTGFMINSVNAADVISGSVIITLENSTSFRYVASGVLCNDATNSTFTVSGVKELSATLDRISVTANSVDTFNAGEINIAYI